MSESNRRRDDGWAVAWTPDPLSAIGNTEYIVRVYVLLYHGNVSVSSHVIHTLHTSDESELT